MFLLCGDCEGVVAFGSSDGVHGGKEMCARIVVESNRMCVQGMYADLFWTCEKVESNVCVVYGQHVMLKIGKLGKVSSASSLYVIWSSLLELCRVYWRCVFLSWVDLCALC